MDVTWSVTDGKTPKIPDNFPVTRAKTGSPSTAHTTKHSATPLPPKPADERVLIDLLAASEALGVKHVFWDHGEGLDQLFPRQDW